MKMKTISNLKKISGKISAVFAFVLAITIVNDGFAQYTVTPRMGDADSKFGIRGGINLSNFHGGRDDIDTDNMKMGLNAGLFFKGAITPFFAIQPEVLYSNRGNRREFGAGSQTGQGAIRFNLHYVEVPLLGVVNLGRNFNIHAGPYVAYLLGAETRIESGDDNFRERYDDIRRGNFNAWDYGVVGGIGLDLFPVQISARYLYGMNDIGRDVTIAPVTGDARNSVLQLTLGLGF